MNSGRIDSTPTVDTDNPWPGLLPYREADQAFFYGRDAECDGLLRLVQRESPLTVLYGLSGLGKSSLLQAGLFPQLRKLNILPIYIRLGYSPDQADPVSQIKQAIANAVASEQIDAPPGSGGETLWEYFHRRDADFWNQRNRLQLPLLVFDQFEEFFTFGRLYPERAAIHQTLLTELADLIEGRPPAALQQQLESSPGDVAAFDFTRHGYKVLFSLREDFLPELEELRPAIPSIGHNRMRLQRMRGSAALEVVLQAQGLIDKPVAEQIVRFVAAEEQADIPLGELELEPALLSLVCRELNNRCQQTGEARITADLLEGSREQILSGFYERSIGDLGPDVRGFIEEQLLTVSGFRDSVALENALDTAGVTGEAIERMVDRRLLRREERAGVQRLELTHDLLTGVIANSRDRRRKQEAELQREKEISALERQKRLEQQASSARRMRWLTACLAVAVTLALGAFYFAEHKRQLAQEQSRLAQERLDRIRDSASIRQQVLAGNFDPAQWAKYITRDIRFLATARSRGYKNPSGDTIYTFELFPDEASIPGGVNSLGLITYRVAHSTFKNSLMTTGPDRHFRANYDGWGCMTRVITLIEYRDYEKEPSVVIFDMCKLLGR